MSTDLPHDHANPFEATSSLGGPGRIGPGSVPRWIWMLAPVYAIAVGAIRSIDSLDRAIANILTLVCTFLAGAAIYVWFCFLSRYSSRVRKTVMVIVPGAIGLLLGLLRIDGVSGTLIPETSWRWARKPDQLLAKSLPPPFEQTANDRDVAAPGEEKSDPPEAGQTDEAADPATPRADLQTTTPDDFPQFLGPRRSGWLPEPALERDWSSHPPKLVWRSPIGAGWSAFSVVNGFAVTLEQRDEDEWTVCYEALTGKPVRRHAEHTRHSTVLGGVGPRSTPTVADGKVYALGATGILNCLDGSTGAVVWQHRLLEEYDLTPDVDIQNIAWGRAASPLVVDGLVVVPAGGLASGPKASLVAFDKDSGTKIWEGGDDQIAYASPGLGTLAGVRQILSVNETSVTGHDPETGKVFWSFPWEGLSNQNANNSQAIAVAGDRVFVSKGYSGGSALVKILCDDKAQWTTEPIWVDAKAMKTKFTNAVVYEDHVYGLSDGTLECIELATGKRRWKHGRYGHGQILGVRDLLIVVAETGEVFLVALDATAHRELGRLAALDGKTWNNPALYGRYLLVRNSEQAACYELPVVGAAP